MNRAEDKNEDERAFELAEKKAQRGQPPRVPHAIGTDYAKLLCGNFGEQATLARAESSARLCNFTTQ